MSKVVDLKQYLKIRLWIRPQSFKHFSFISLFYLFFLGFTILFMGGFIQLANAIILFAGMVVLFMSLLASFLTVALGDNKVIFKNDKKVAV